MTEHIVHTPGAEPVSRDEPAVVLYSRCGKMALALHRGAPGHPRLRALVARLTKRGFEVLAALPPGLPLESWAAGDTPRQVLRAARAILAGHAP